MRICGIEDCKNKHVARGWCMNHYKRWKRHGDPRYKNRSVTVIFKNEYGIYQGMIARCSNSTLSAYRYYGGKGITVCTRWLDGFSNFIEDMGPRPSSRHTIDRIDVNGNYEPRNCRWATYTEQLRNRGLLHINKSGYTGVSWDKQKKKWRADIKTNHKQKLIGRFDTLEAAAEARKKAELAYW